MSRRRGGAAGERMNWKLPNKLTVGRIVLAGVFFVLFSVMSFGSITTGEVAGPMFVVAIVGAILLFVALYVVGLSAFGGYVGAAFADSRTERRLAEELGPTDQVRGTVESTDDERAASDQQAATADDEWSGE